MTADNNSNIVTNNDWAIRLDFGVIQEYPQRNIESKPETEFEVMP